MLLLIYKPTQSRFKKNCNVMLDDKKSEQKN